MTYVNAGHHNHEPQFHFNLNKKLFLKVEYEIALNFLRGTSASLKYIIIKYKIKVSLTKCFVS